MKADIESKALLLPLGEFSYKDEVCRA